MADLGAAVNEPTADVIASMAAFLDANPEQVNIPPADPNKVDQSTDSPERSSSLSDEEQRRAEQAVADEETQKRLDAQAPDEDTVTEEDVAADSGTDAPVEKELQPKGGEEDLPIEMLSDLAELFPESDEVTEDSLLDLQVVGREEGEQVSLREVIDSYRNGPTETQQVTAKVAVHAEKLDSAHDERIEELTKVTASLIDHLQSEFKGFDWDQMQTDNPEEWIRMTKRRTAINEGIQRSLQTMDAQMGTRKKEADIAKQAFFTDQVDIIDKLHPDWSKDGNKLGAAAMEEVQAYALRERFSPEMMSILDYGQAIDTIWKAVQYDKAQAAKPALRKQLRRLPKTLRATARAAETAPREERQKRRDALVAAHSERGTVHSAAALFEELQSR